MTVQTPIRKSPLPFQLTNSSTGKKESFTPLVPGEVKFYSCGPTVYDFIHIGNLRAVMVSDLFFRFFQYAGYRVTYVRNYTDVDDKIIQRANKEGLTPSQVSERFIQEVERDYALAGILEPTHKTKVTDHMGEIISMIQKIIENGHAYAVDGEVYFSIGSFPAYGKVSGRNLDTLLEGAGARVEVDPRKRSPLDFTLWKPAKPGEPYWESPWGKGRPGWHIECSAMSSKWLGDQMDVHHGGEDLLFPHHENECAQSEAASHHAPFVRYWVHNAFLNLNQEKMSKSLGNVITARQVLERLGGEFARTILLSVHYRTLMDFSDDSVTQAASALSRIYEAKAKALQLLGLKSSVPDLKAENAWGQFVAEAELARKKIQEAFCNDLNTPEALGHIFNLIREFNRTCAEAHGESTPGAVLGAHAFLGALEDTIGVVMGIGRQDPAKILQEVEKVRLAQGGDKFSNRPAASEIEQLIEERKQARLAKNFARSDEIRKDLEKRGVLLKDGPTGTTWSYL